ncbi:hypothetical protein ABPG72_004903 [Tetrahymena utriculariae]
MQYSQPKLSQTRPFFNGIQDEIRNLVQSPSQVNMAESLDLIKYKFYQDIIKQKSDQRAQQTPLSYSKSIQYLGKDANIFLKTTNQVANILENNEKRQNGIQQKISKYFQNANSFKNNFSKVPNLKQQDYWSPVDSRVRKLIQKSTLKQQKYQQELKDNLIEQDSNQGQHIENDFLNTNHNQFQQKLQINTQQDKFCQYKNQDDETKSFSTQANGNQALIGSSINKNNSSKMSSVYQKREHLLIQEKFALQSPNKVQLKNLENPQLRLFTPLKINPPFIKKPYTEKSKTYTMGFLKASINEYNQQPNVIHANDRLRQSWQNRIGNSQSKSSLVNEEMMQTNGWKQFRKTTERLFIQMPSSEQQQQQQEREICNNQQMEASDKNQSKSNFEQLMDYANYKNYSNYQQQLNQVNNQESADQMIQNEIVNSDINMQCLSNRSNLSHLNYQGSTQYLNKTKSDGFNHFYKSNVLMKDLEKIQTQKIKAQLSNKQGFKQQALISEGETIIQNQLPGSKIILKEVHQRNLSQKSNIDSNHKVFYTLPERVNFFKSKNFGNSYQQNNRLHNQNISVK